MKSHYVRPGVLLYLADLNKEHDPGLGGLQNDFAMVAAS